MSDFELARKCLTSFKNKWAFELEVDNSHELDDKAVHNSTLFEVEARKHQTQNLL